MRKLSSEVQYISMAIKGVVKPSPRVGFVLHAALLWDFAHAGGAKHVPLEVASAEQAIFCSLLAFRPHLQECNHLFSPTANHH